MKVFISILLVLLSTGCTSETTVNVVDNTEDIAKQSTLNQADSDPLSIEKLHEAIALAKQNKDYRLLATSGRSVSIPGVDGSNFRTLIELCGKNYSAGAGDVITSQEQRLARKKLVDYMRQYNEQMLVICQNEHAK